MRNLNNSPAPRLFSVTYRLTPGSHWSVDDICSLTVSLPLLQPAPLRILGNQSKNNFYSFYSIDKLIIRSPIICIDIFQSLLRGSFYWILMTGIITCTAGPGSLSISVINRNGFLGVLGLNFATLLIFMAIVLQGPRLFQGVWYPKQTKSWWSLTLSTTSNTITRMRL